MGIPALLVVALFVLFFQPQPQEPQAHPPSDIICSLDSISVTSRAVPGSKEPPRCHVSAVLHIRAPEDVTAAARTAAITEVLDEDGKDILVKHDRDTARLDDARRQLCYELCNSLSYRNGDPTGIANADLAAIPGAISSFSGEVDVLAARNIVREKVELKVMEEPIELVPGLTFLLTSVDEEDTSTKISFEVHTKRWRDKAEGEPGLEPVFAGLIALGLDGKPTQTLNNGSDFDTRDEHILIVTDMTISSQDVAAWQVCALDKIEKARLTFCTKRLKVAEEGR